MPSYTTQDIRNIALVGGAGAGKTMLLEALCKAAGVIQQKGEIARGTTLSDHLPQERALKHSLASTLISFDYQGTHLNIIDTPGLADFHGRALAVLPAVETVAVVIDARTGPDMSARRMMQWAQERGLDRLLIINRIDTAPGELASCLARVQNAFGAHCLPLNLPGHNADTVIDCFFAPDGAATDFSSVAQAHTALVDQVVEVDDALMQLYLEQGEELSPEQLHDPFEVALRQDHLVPVCFTSATSDAGIEDLLRICCRLLPNPGEGNPPDFYRGNGAGIETVHFAPRVDGHVLAHTFKVAIDPFVGRLALVRMHQGRFAPGAQLVIGDARRAVTVANLLTVHGARTAPLDKAIAGDICAIAKLDGLEYDSVLHDSHDEDHVHVRPLNIPPPMQAVAVTARTRGEEQKMSDALRKLTAEDPSVVVEHDHALNQTVLRAQGELHLRTLFADLRDRFHVEIETTAPRIAYRETITHAAEGHARHKKQTGGAGQFGEVYLRVRPLARGEGVRFVDAVVGGAIPRQFLPAVEKGVRAGLAAGAVAGYPVEDIEVEVYDGKYHAVDSKEVAFVAAGRKALSDALGKAQPIVLEPVVALSVASPASHVGDITGDLSSRRGRINETVAQDGGGSVINALVPLAELSDYASHLKSITAGHGSYSLSFSHHEGVPPRVQQSLHEAWRPAAAAD